jgi:phosphoglycolate phosphatase-like HAD superfamily hydrolase
VSFLVLFDVDGTLLLSHDEVYVAANRAALLEVYGIAPEGPDRPGDTATSHTRRALRLAGVSDEEIDAGLERWCAAMSAQYVELLAGADTSGWRVSESARAVVPRIEHRALLTGNPEPVARARLDRIGLLGVFPDGHGAFGCEREDRVELVELALAREGGWLPERTVAVGDTPLDIASAHAASILSVAVTTGAFGPDELRDADRIIDNLSELPAALDYLETIQAGARLRRARSSRDERRT